MWRLDNATLQQKVGHVAGGYALLLATGFRYAADSKARAPA
jgi:hypothetical protein